MTKHRRVFFDCPNCHWRGKRSLKPLRSAACPRCSNKGSNLIPDATGPDVDRWHAACERHQTAMSDFYNKKEREERAMLAKLKKKYEDKP